MITTRVAHIEQYAQNVYLYLIMKINWGAVVTGFVVAVVLGVLVAWMGITETTVYLLAVPGLIGGFVAGYMVSGASEGAVHGALATVVGALALLFVTSIVAVLFVGIIPVVAGASVALLALLVQAIPGGIAGALGGYIKGRRVPEPATATSR